MRLTYKTDYMRHEKQLQSDKIPAKVAWEIVFSVIAVMAILFVCV